MSVTSSLRGRAGFAGACRGIAASICARIAASRRSPPRIWPAGVFSMSFTRADIAGHITRSNPATFFIMSASVAPVDSTVMDSGLMPCSVDRQEEIAEPAAPSPSGTTRPRAPSALRSEAVTCSSLSFTNTRPFTALMPACAQPPRCALTPSRLLRPSSAAITVFGSPLLSSATLISNSCASLSSSARIRRIGARDDERHVDRLGELEHPAPHGGVGPDVVDSIRHDRLGNLAETIDDRGALVWLKALVERLRHFEAGDLRARGFDGGEGDHVRLRERVGEGHPFQRRGGHRHTPAEPHVVIGSTHANRARDRHRSAASRPTAPAAAVGRAAAAATSAPCPCPAGAGAC